MARRRTRAGAPASRLGGALLWLAITVVSLGIAWIWWKSATPPHRATAAGVPGSPPEPGQAATAARPTQGRPPPASSVSEATPSLPSVAPPPIALPATGAPSNTPATPAPAPTPAAPTESATWLARDRMVAVQLALIRRGISPGPIDGVIGSQTRSALRVFQQREGLAVTGALDERTLARLQPQAEGLYGIYTVAAEDLTRLTPVPSSWLGKSSRDRLDFETVLELVAERYRSHPRLIRQLNPRVDWYRITAGTILRVPLPAAPALTSRAARVRIHLEGRTLAAFDGRDNLLLHFPCSIARRVEKRPVGILHVAKVAPNPNYRFDPDIFPESAEGRRLGRPLMIPPGPNNPVGTAWIGLDRPGYGIHGTPHPEDVGRTESHGCFRLANWDAELLLKLVWVGMPVVVEP